MNHIFKYIKIYSFLLFIILVITFGITVYLDYNENRITESQTIINGISILGVYFTILGIGYTFKQVISVKEEVQNTLGELNEFLSFSDISSKIIQIQEIQNFILHSKPELALIRMKDLRSHLIQIKFNKRLSPYFEIESISEKIMDLGIDITNINETILNGKRVNYSIVNKHLDETIIYLEEIVSQLKNKKI